jgi:gluconate:H+ symporter, GntP family
MEINSMGPILGLFVAILLIIKKVQPFYALLLGALVGGILGGANLPKTVTLIVDGAKGMTPAVLRILAAGILAGTLIQSGAAHKISLSIINTIGKKYALLAIILATFCITAVGVFIYVSVITIAPIAIVTAKECKISKTAILVAMIGGGKAGNIVSPNPNTIAAADFFKLDLSALIVAGIIPAIFGIAATFIISKIISKKGINFDNEQVTINNDNLPSLASALAAPLFVICLLALRPIFNIQIDPMFALPAGAIFGMLMMKKIKFINDYATFGIEKIMGIVIILLGTGAVSGIIAGSTFKNDIIYLMTTFQIPNFLLAPISGIIMGAATASTTSGTAVASSVFGQTLLSMKFTALASAAMIHTGATVLDHLPHGSFFHATGGSVMMTVKQRLGVIPYETIIGTIMCLVSTLIYAIF